MLENECRPEGSPERDRASTDRESRGEVRQGDVVCGETPADPLQDRGKPSLFAGASELRRTFVRFAEYRNDVLDSLCGVASCLRDIADDVVRFHELIGVRHGDEGALYGHLDRLLYEAGLLQTVRCQASDLLLAWEYAPDWARWTKAASFQELLDEARASGVRVTLFGQGDKQDDAHTE